MLLTKELLKTQDIDATILEASKLQLAVFAESYGIVYDRTATFVIQGNKYTLEMTWAKNNLYLHATVGDKVSRFLKEVVFTFAKPIEETQLANRKAICAACPLFDSSSTKCRSCGCYMAVKWGYDKSTCPLNKWQ